MLHITYPTPTNGALDISHDHKHDFLKKKNLEVIGGQELLDLQAIAKYWAEDHGAGTYRKQWTPVYKRVKEEVLRRLDAGRVDGHIRMSNKAMNGLRSMASR